MKAICFINGLHAIALGNSLSSWDVLWKRDQGRDWDFPAIVVRVVERSERDMHILSILCLRSWEHILGHSMRRARSHAQFSGLDSYLWVSLQTLESPLPHWAYLCFLPLPEFIVFSDLGLDLILESVPHPLRTVSSEPRLDPGHYSVSSS